MAGPEFFQTRRGQVFYERDVPELIESLRSISKELKRANDLKEKEQKNEQE